ncbi:MAG TPA: hypothetical protein VNJ08_10450 [Bacteriovoracaceae bacterium]|nr:hypothetical protein [Bacteriovoracaceae bacterium]
MADDSKKSDEILQAFKHAMRGFYHFAETVKPIMDKFLVYAPEIKKVIEGLEYWHRKSEELAVELQKDDVFLIPYFSEIPNIPKLVERIKSENKSMLDIYDETFCQEVEVTKLLDTWMDNPFFMERRQIFERCLIAHTNKEFILTIPIFYIHIEKYCKYLLQIDTDKTYKWKAILKKTYSKEEEGISKFMSEAYAVQFLTDQIFEHYPKYKELADPLYPNRHNVLHGSDLDYFNKKYASLRCILLLDILSDMEPKPVPKPTCSETMKRQEGQP